MKEKPEMTRVKRPHRILQFGEGNFLRAFVDYMVDVSNERGTMDSLVTLVKPIDYGNFDRFSRQDNLYTVILRGAAGGEPPRIVSAIGETVDPFTQFDEYNRLMEREEFRFFVSNTTEAGITFVETDEWEDELPAGFPGKVTKLLYQRFRHFKGDISKGFIFLPVELIEKNGDNLKKCVFRYIDHWDLEDEFRAWVEDANIFCNTLVDRIVSGYPRGEEAELWESLGYRDELMVTGEPFGFWAIGSERIDEVEAEWTVSSPIEVVFAKDIEPYKQRKVRILNGAHTSTVLAAYLCGYDLVDQCLADPVVAGFMESALTGEIIPHIRLDRADLDRFAAAVAERFRNPHLNHKLLDISLNSTAKWRARVMPSLLDHRAATGELPRFLTFSLAAYIAFYRDIRRDGEGFVNYRDGVAYPVRDDRAVLDFYDRRRGAAAGELTREVLSCRDFWGRDLTEIDGLEEAVAAYLSHIEKGGMKGAMADLLPLPAEV